MSKEQFELYQHHATNAGNFFHQGRQREGANEYWIAFSQYSPSLTETNRWHTFRGYTSILTEQYFAPSRDDWKNLKSVLRDKHELILFRLNAGLTLGLLYYYQGDRFESGEMYYEAIQIGESKVSKLEKKQLQKNKFQEDNKLYTMDYLVKDVMKMVKDNLERLATKTTTDPLVVAMTNFPKYSEKSIIASDIVHEYMTAEELQKLLSIGGKECDACGKQETTERKLLQCGRCKKGYYCSKPCQETSWTVYQHKKYCRTKTKPIKSGDFVLLHGLISRTELNNTVGQVVGRDPTDIDNTRWEIKWSKHRKSLSIHAKNIKQLRPFDCLRRQESPKGGAADD